MYKFSLGPVLNHRKFLEENLQKELGPLKKQLVDKKNKLAKLKDSRRQFRSEWQSKQQQTMTVSESLLYVRFFEKISGKITQQTEHVSEAENAVDAKRADLIEAVKKRKALEILKEKGFKRYQQRILLNERNFIDEMASVRFKPKG